LRIAVIGGSGLLGSTLCRRLVELGHSISSISRRGKPAVSDPTLDAVQWHAAELASTESLEILKSSQIVYHLASSTIPSTSNANVLFDIDSNVVSTLRVLEHLRGTDTRIVFTSSGGTVYGRPQTVPIPEEHPTNPISAYGIHKLTIEKYLYLYREVHGLSSVIVRPANIYGETQDMSKPLGALGHFARRAYDGVPIDIWGDGTTTRDYIHVDDVATVLLRAAEYSGSHHVFNAGSGAGISLMDIVAALDALLGRASSLHFHEGRSFDVPTNVLNSSLAAKELGWKADVSLTTGLERMITAFAASASAELTGKR
jgi:UDP-glucose 4-epimerase